MEEVLTHARQGDSHIFLDDVVESLAHFIVQKEGLSFRPGFVGYTLHSVVKFVLCSSYLLLGPGMEVSPKDGLSVWCSHSTLLGAGTLKVSNILLFSYMPISLSAILSTRMFFFLLHNTRFHLSKLLGTSVHPRLHENLLGEMTMPFAPGLSSWMSATLGVSSQVLPLFLCSLCVWSLMRATPDVARATLMPARRRRERRTRSFFRHEQMAV